MYSRTLLDILFLIWGQTVADYKMLSFHLSINVIIIVVSFKILDLCPIALFQQLWNTLYILTITQACWDVYGAEAASKTIQKLFSNWSNLKKVTCLMSEKFHYYQNKDRSTPKNAWGRHRSDTKLHEETWNAARNLCWQSAQDPCLIVFEICRCSWRSDLKICLLSEKFPIFLHIN